VKIADALRAVNRLFIDSAPLIYLIETNPTYFARVTDIFDRIDDGTLPAAASPITLAECLVAPIRQGLVQLQQAYIGVLVSNSNITFAVTDDRIAVQAADIRARYRLALPDAIQVATALATSCDALLTNDIALKRVQELPILLLDDLEF